MFEVPFDLKKVKGILFDCYDTLVDIKTDEGNTRTYEMLSNWLIYQGVRITPDRLRDTYKQKVHEQMEASWERHPDVRVEEIFTRICEEHAVWEIDAKHLGIQTARSFRAASLRRLHAHIKSHRLLDIFQDRPKGVVSNGQRVFSELELRALGFYERFDFVIFSSDVGCKKPNPRIYIMALERLNLAPEETLFIGDGYENDIVGPLKIGMQALFIDEAWRYFNL